MSLFHLFRSFLPLHNPIGFGASDFIELALAAMLVIFLLGWRWVEPSLGQFAGRTGLCMAILALLPVALRLALLPRCPVPVPGGSDDFSYILLADTLRHFRLANPPHALPQFFESIFVLQNPSYSSIYPAGSGLVLALGWLLFGTPWAGILLSIAALCALCYWMLLAWTTPRYALLGGLLAVVQFGPLSQWTNSYWGGSVSAAAGCLVFGSLPRLAESKRKLPAAFLGLGLSLQLLTRPFEFALLSVCVLMYFAPLLRKKPDVRTAGRLSGLVLIAIVPALALTVAQNRAVTGNWTTLPYQLSRYQYGVPTTFTVQPNPTPHHTLTAEQDLDYRAQAAIHGDDADTIASYLERLLFRVRYYRFFFLAPLYLALIAFLAAIREYRFVWVVLTFLVFALGTNFYPYFYPHYIAVLTPLFVLASVTGLASLSRIKIHGWAVGRELSLLLVFLCAAQFVFWYGIHLSGSEAVLPAVKYETWDFINYGDPEGRIAIGRQLAQAQGKQLVFVRYWPQHRFHEWIHNEADIDSSNVVWACDLGAQENEKLQQYYPNRTSWLLEPDAQPPRLVRYQIDEVPLLTTEH